MCLSLMLAAAWYGYQHTTGSLAQDWWIPLVVLGVVLAGGVILGERAGRRFGGPKREVRR